MTTPVTDDAVAEALARVVDSIHPLKVVLFGSRARGDARKDSGIDLLVVVPDGADHAKLYLDGYRSMIGLHTAVDILIIDESEVERHRNDKFSVVFPALSEGRVVHAV